MTGFPPGACQSRTARPRGSPALLRARRTGRFPHPRAIGARLRTPLAALRLRLDFLAEDADQQMTAEVVGAQEEISRLSRLVDGLLAAARAENVVIRPVLVAADQVIHDRADAWRLAAAERDVEVSCACPGPVRAGLGEGHLEQIPDNLLANALEQCPLADMYGCAAPGPRGSRWPRLRWHPTGPA